MWFATAVPISYTVIPGKNANLQVRTAITRDIVTAVNSDTILYGSFGLYPSYVAGILNSVKEIHFYVLCSEKINFADYVKNVFSVKIALQVSYKLRLKIVTEHRFQLTFGGETIKISIETRQFPKVPPELIFAQSVLKKIHLSSPAYGIVCINKIVTYINNKVLTSKHNCVIERYNYDLELPKKLAVCTLYTQDCSMYRKKTYPFYILYCTKKCFEIPSAIVNYV